MKVRGEKLKIQYSDSEWSSIDSDLECPNCNASINVKMRKCANCKLRLVYKYGYQQFIKIDVAPVKLTKRQTLLLVMFHNMTANHIKPTYAEIGERLGISLKGVYDHIIGLCRKGALVRGDGKGRATIITPAGYLAMSSVSRKIDLRKYKDMRK